MNEQLVNDIVKEVLAKLQIAENPAGKHGVFTDMNDAIAAAKQAQAVIRTMSMDQREKIVSNIRRKTKEQAETLARMGVEETGMGNVGHKILKHILVAEKTPGTEDITTTSIIGIVMITVGIIALGFVEQHEDEEVRQARQERANRKYAKSILGTESLIKDILARTDITSVQKAQAIAKIISRADSNDTVKSLLRTVFKSDKLTIEDKFLVLEAAFDTRIALPKNSNTDVNYIISELSEIIKIVKEK